MSRRVVPILVLLAIAACKPKPDCARLAGERDTARGDLNVAREAAKRGYGDGTRAAEARLKAAEKTYEEQCGK